MTEPNGVLVMTTCKCRENANNLVMTRAWFEEQLQSKIDQGIVLEQKRILKMLENFAEVIDTAVKNKDCNSNEVWDAGFLNAINLIKGRVN